MCIGHKKQINSVVDLLWKTKKDYLERLSVKDLFDNKNFWKTSKSYFSNKGQILVGRSGKNNSFFDHNFFKQHHLVFVEVKLLFCATSTFFCWHETCFHAASTFWPTSKSKLLFSALFRMLCHGNIFFLLSRNKNIITSQKINGMSGASPRKFLWGGLCKAWTYYPVQYSDLSEGSTKTE